jgi:hypothetical protein
LSQFQSKLLKSKYKNNKIFFVPLLVSYSRKVVKIRRKKKCVSGESICYTNYRTRYPEYQPLFVSVFIIPRKPTVLLTYAFRGLHANPFLLTKFHQGTRPSFPSFFISVGDEVCCLLNSDPYPTRS